MSEMEMILTIIGVENIYILLFKLSQRINKEKIYNAIFNVAQQNSLTSWPNSG